MRQIFTSKCFFSFCDSQDAWISTLLRDVAFTWRPIAVMLVNKVWYLTGIFQYGFPASAVSIRQSINIASFVFLHLACVAAGPRTRLNHLRTYVWGRFTRKVNTYLRRFNERVSWVMHVFLFCFVLFWRSRGSKMQLYAAVFCL